MDDIPDWPTVRAFAGLCIVGWLNRVTSGVSLLATAYGLLTSHREQRYVFVLIGILSGVLLAFNLWRGEQKKFLAACDREAKLDAELRNHDSIIASFDESCVDFMVDRLSNGEIVYSLGRLALVVENKSLTKSIYDLKAKILPQPHDFFSLLFLPESELIQFGGFERHQEISAMHVRPGDRIELLFVQNANGPSSGRGRLFEALFQEQTLTIEVTARNTTKKVVLLRYDPLSSPYFRIFDNGHH